jgi:membrane protease YdiL (CAAX protease family)
MIGVILLVLSWLLLRFEGKSLRAIGFNQPVKRSAEFAWGILLASAFVVVQFLLIAYFAGFEWRLNPDFNLRDVLLSARWNVNSVLFEEFIFRGYLLYKTISMLGTGRGCWLSAAAFGIYHWFSYEVFGAPVQMIYVFVLTGMFGLVLAYAFAKTGSLFLPVALHLGWNLTTGMVFSNGPLGEQLLIPSQAEMAVLSVVQQLLTSIAFPMVLVGLVIWLLHYQPSRSGH